MKRLFMTLLLLMFACNAVNAAVLGLNMQLPDARHVTMGHCPGHDGHQDHHAPAKQSPGHCVSCAACLPAMTVATFSLQAPLLQTALNPHNEDIYTSLPSRQLQRPPSFS
jgi:hypothetical protein